MSDDIDSRMADLWPTLTKAAAEKLKDDKVSLCVPTQLLTDTRAARFNVAWTPVLTTKRPPGVVLTKGAPTSARNLVAFGFAVEETNIGEEQLEDSAELTETVKELSAKARDNELSAVLEIICGSRPGPNNLKYAEHDIGTAVEILDKMAGFKRQYRLVGTGGPAKLVKETGKVHDVVDPMGQLPDQVRGLVIAMVGGPVVQRIEKDLALSWRRTSAETVRLRISERFFVVNAQESVPLI